MGKTEKLIKLIDENTKKITQLMDAKDYKGVNDFFSSVSNINIYTELPDFREGGSARENKYYIQISDTRNGKIIETRLLAFIDPKTFNVNFE